LTLDLFDLEAVESEGEGTHAVEPEEDTQPRTYASEHDKGSSSSGEEEEEEEDQPPKPSKKTKATSFSSGESPPLPTIISLFNPYFPLS
jgi:hypothetical protein